MFTVSNPFFLGWIIWVTVSPLALGAWSALKMVPNKVFVRRMIMLGIFNIVGFLIILAFQSL
jgi:hypothetical protein